jgi:DNA-directed RNA polymerase subunit RPC12/RpoP
VAIEYYHWCLGCGADSITGTLVYECPRCGGTLVLEATKLIGLPGPPEPRRSAIDDVIEGFERLLGETA